MLFAQSVRLTFRETQELVGPALFLVPLGRSYRMYYIAFTPAVA
jgi:hypothetical protein